MPGNKNSGRKKKIVSVKDTDDDTDTPLLVKKKRGRPRKENPVSVPNEQVRPDEVRDDQISICQNSFTVCSLSKRTSETNLY